MNLRSKIFISYLLVLVLYGIVILLPAPDPAMLAHYHLSVAGARLVGASILIPSAIIWFAAFYGYSKFRIYNKLISGTKDGVAINKLTRGIMILAFSSPIYGIFSGILNFIAHHNHAFLSSSVIIENYTNLLLALVAFIFISNGAQGLANLTKTRPKRCAPHALILLMTALGVTYCYLLSNAKVSMETTYHLPGVLVFATLVVPYVYIWFLGIYAAYEIHTYSRMAAGIVYRRSWDLLSLGLSGLIVVSIFLQYLTTITAHLGDLSLLSVLALIYFLLALYAAAFVLVAIGAKKLIMIEEV